jgi:hypothetical protein
VLKGPLQKMDAKDWASEFEKIRKIIQLKRQSYSIFDEREVKLFVEQPFIELIYFIYIKTASKDLRLHWCTRISTESDDDCTYGI